MFRPVSAGKKAALVLACVSMAASLVFSGAARAADMIKVLIDEAKVFEYPDGVSTIIIGNPVVADITMLRKNNRMILTGKSFGRTNLLMLDNLLDFSHLSFVHENSLGGSRSIAAGAVGASAEGASSSCCSSGSALFSAARQASDVAVLRGMDAGRGGQQ